LFTVIQFNVKNDGDALQNFGKALRFESRRARKQKRQTLRAGLGATEEVAGEESYVGGALGEAAPEVGEPVAMCSLTFLCAPRSC